MSIIIQVSELKYTTEEGQRVFTSVSLSVQRGELVCVVGPASSGKSLLLRLLAREVEPQRGQILVDDRNVTRISKDRLLELRRRLGIMPQDAKPLGERTLYESLLLKLRVMGYDAPDAERKALDALEATQLGGLREMLVPELSPANQKLFHIALAACHGPGILLLDEPFGGLEFQEGLQVLAGLRQLHDLKRPAILLMTRERSLAQQSGGRVVYLQNGVITPAPPSPSSTASPEPVTVEPQRRGRKR
jgi:cell division transport system ATP-binding protein